MPEYAKINREILSTHMSETLKRSFIVLVQHHPVLPKADRDFICDNIHHYEDITQTSRNDVMDVLDAMELFICKK